MTRCEDDRLQREAKRRHTRDLAGEMREVWPDRMEREAEAVARETDRRLERGDGCQARDLMDEARPRRRGRAFPHIRHNV